MCCHGPVPHPFTCHYHCGTDTLENQLCEILSRGAITNASIGEKIHLKLVGKVFPPLYLEKQQQGQKGKDFSKSALIASPVSSP